MLNLHLLKYVIRKKPLRNSKDDGYLTLPFVNDAIVAKVNKVIRKSKFNVKVSWRNENKLKNLLVKSAISPVHCPAGSRRCRCCENGLRDRCTEKNVVYKIHCNLCSDVFYIGETKRPVRLRFNEHVNDAINRTPDTPLGDHFRGAHSSLVLDRTSSLPLNVSILARARDYPDRKILESLCIRDKKPCLNSQMSSWPVL